MRRLIIENQEERINEVCGQVVSNPYPYVITGHYQNGDCFLTAIAQSLEEAIAIVYNEESVRKTLAKAIKACNPYYTEARIQINISKKMMELFKKAQEEEANLIITYTDEGEKFVIRRV